MADALNAYEPPDHLADAVSVARRTLKSNPWESLKVAVPAGILAPGTIAGTLFSLKDVLGVDNALVAASFWISLLLAGPTVYLAFEIRRLGDRSSALSELLGALRQYEVLIRDARDERNHLREQLSTLEGRNTALQFIAGVTALAERAGRETRNND